MPIVARIDHLARALAQPMPRRRALKILGAAALSTAVPLGRPGVVRGQSTGIKCTEDAYCPSNTSCCVTSSIQVQCCQSYEVCQDTPSDPYWKRSCQCANPCGGPGGVCCESFGKVCRDGRCGNPCPPNTTPCGPVGDEICCQAGEECCGEPGNMRCMPPCAKGRVRCEVDRCDCHCKAGQCVDAGSLSKCCLDSEIAWNPGFGSSFVGGCLPRRERLGKDGDLDVDLRPTGPGPMDVDVFLETGMIVTTSARRRAAVVGRTRRRLVPDRRAAVSVKLSRRGRRALRRHGRLRVRLVITMADPSSGRRVTRRSPTFTLRR